MAIRTCDPKAPSLHGKDSLLSLYEITQPDPVQPIPRDEWPREDDKIMVFPVERKIVKKNGQDVVNYKMPKAQITMQRRVKAIEL